MRWKTSSCEPERVMTHRNSSLMDCSHAHCGDNRDQDSNWVQASTQTRTSQKQQKRLKQAERNLKSGSPVQSAESGSEEDRSKESHKSPRTKTHSYMSPLESDSDLETRSSEKPDDGVHAKPSRSQTKRQKRHKSKHVQNKTKEHKSTESDSENRQNTKSPNHNDLNANDLENTVDKLREKIPVKELVERGFKTQDAEYGTESDCLEHMTKQSASHDDGLSVDGKEVFEGQAKQHNKKTKTQDKPVSQDFSREPENIKDTSRPAKLCRNQDPVHSQVCGIKSQMAVQTLKHSGKKPFECEECGKHYTSSSNLRIHQLSHSGKKDFICNECGQMFTHLPYLKRHLLKHSGRREHTCDHCGRSFYQKYHLSRHMLLHTGETPYKCNTCGMTFNRSDNLGLHMRSTHLSRNEREQLLQEKLFKCMACDKIFVSNSHLEVHMRTHTGERPYTCNLCERSFAQTSQLNSHIRSHFGEKPHICDVCHKKFSRKTYLRAHSDRVHGKTNESPIVTF